MSADRRIIEAAVGHWNAGDLDAYMAMYDDAAVLHGYGPRSIGKADAHAFYGEMMTAFPGSQVTLDDVLECDDQLVVRYTQSCVHKDVFMGVAATGRHMNLVGIVIDRHRAGHVVERFSIADMLTVFEQLNAYPPGVVEQVAAVL